MGVPTHVELDDVIGPLEDALAAAGLGGLREWEEGPKSKRARTRVLGEEELLEELAIQVGANLVPTLVRG